MNMPKRDSAGQYPKWIELCPMYYVDKGGLILCAPCASRDIDQSQEAIAADINWEDMRLHCEDCGARIEAACGD